MKSSNEPFISFGKEEGFWERKRSHLLDCGKPKEVAHLLKKPKTTTQSSELWTIASMASCLLYDQNVQFVITRLETKTEMTQRRGRDRDCSRPVWTKSAARKSACREERVHSRSGEDRSGAVTRRAEGSAETSPRSHSLSTCSRGQLLGNIQWTNSRPSQPSNDQKYTGNWYGGISRSLCSAVRL